MRSHKDEYICIVCYEKTSNSVICRECEHDEMQKQKKDPSSVTAQQLWFMKEKLGIDMITIQEVVQKVNPECVWDLENLSCVEAKKIISILQGIKEENDK